MKHITAILSALLALCVLPARADTQDIINANNQVSAQFTQTNVDYTETGNGLPIPGAPSGTLDTENGNIYGYGLSFSNMSNWWLGNDYVKVNYTHSNGDTSYVGMPITGGVYGSITGSDGSRLNDYYLRYGKGFGISANAMLTPYFEIGYHEWDRSINTGEDYTGRYYGLGLLADYTPIHKLTLNVNLFGANTYGGHVSIVDQSASGSLGSSTLWRAGVGADYAFTQHFHASVNVDYTHFSYGLSTPFLIAGSFVGYEPNSTTNYTIVRLGVGYAY